MTGLIFAANWKMHLGPSRARDFLDRFLERYQPQDDREVWFFPAAVAVETVALRLQRHPDIRIGVQNVHWEPAGAYTGEMSVAMAKEAGATVSLVGHSERRHVFGETDAETGMKVRSLLESGVTPLLCVGEKLEEREVGETVSVVKRQLQILDGLSTAAMGQVLVAYEPVWAIGTGKTATPADAAEVHSTIRRWFVDRGVRSEMVKVLYGGSVKADNVRSLLSKPDINGVLVGGASLDPVQWAEISSILLD